MTRQQYGLPVDVGQLLQAPQLVLQQVLLGRPRPLMRGAPPAAASAGARSARTGALHPGLMPRQQLKPQPEAQEHTTLIL